MLKTAFKICKKVLLSASMISVASAAAFAAPSVNAAASPISLPVNLPTVVTVTAVITDPTVISTGVNLLRLRSSGQPQIVGELHDDDVNADDVSGDRKYSLRITLNEPSPQMITFQVSAAFRGLLSRVLSNLVTVTLTAQA